MKLICCVNRQLSGELKSVAKFLRIIGDENRLRILCLLKREERCVCEIWQHLGIAQNLASSHLRVMKDFGLLKSRQEGQKKYYSVSPLTFKKYNALLFNILKKYEK